MLLTFTMRFIFVAALVACASAYVEVSQNYHLEVGIPLAAKIKASEDEIMKTQAASRNANGDRIIGGVSAPANAHPYFAGLLIDLVGWQGQSVCGSSLVSANRLVTAAHCWHTPALQAWRFTVVLGTQFLYWGGQRIQTSTVIMHPNYQHWNLLNDVAMIYLPFNVPTSASIRPIALPNFSDASQNFAGQWASAVGFGRTSDSQPAASEVLSHVSLQVMNSADCLAIYGSGWIFPSTLCTSGTGGVGVCGGDSGGPLAINRNGEAVMIGISSFAATNACEQGFPSGFARVTSFLNFIQQHLW